MLVLTFEKRLMSYPVLLDEGEAFGAFPLLGSSLAVYYVLHCTPCHGPSLLSFLWQALQSAGH
jgi:hypothetical protein